MAQTRIPSRTSAQVYTVTLRDDGTTRCTCPAGRYGKPCWHARAVRAEAQRRQPWEVVSLKSGYRYSTHHSQAEAQAAASAITKAGGWVGVYRS